MHIVFVSREYVPSLRGGGIASYVKDMANGFIEAGHKVTVICASDDTRESSDCLECDGLRIIRLNGGDFIIPEIEGNSLLKKFRCIYRFFSYRKKIRKTILSLGKVDIIEVPEFGAEGYYLMDIKIPVVIRLHTPSFLDRNTFGKKRYPISKFYEYWIAKKEEMVTKKAKYITSCSESLKWWIVKYFGVSKDLICVIYNPIKVSDWIGNRIESKNDCINVLFVGTVAEEKGIGDLIGACNLLVNKGYKVELTIAGKLGEYGNKLKEENKNNPWCIFLGNVKRTDLKTLYSRNEIACFPSWWEAFGIICIEAMATGCIVIGSNSGGMNEIITDKYNGVLVPPKDIDFLANTILNTYKLSTEDKKKIQKNSISTAILNYDIQNIISRTLKYYTNIISNENTLG